MTEIAAGDGTEVLAVLDDLAGAAVVPAIAGTAAAIARLSGGKVRQVSLTAAVSETEAERRVMRELRRSRTASGVLAGYGAPRPLWQRVAQQSGKPVVLVPVGSRGAPPRISRVLMPLDGTARSAEAVAATAGRLSRAAVELIVVHVFDSSTVPMFWDQHAHEGRAWAEEFLARYCAQSGTRLELRSGPAAEHLLDVAASEHADMIVLAWSQRLEPGRAVVVRHVVGNAGVPVLLVPFAAT
jgi:nucleotide-binding universal stress UspA family protein